jgi:hypothetical protein
MHQMSVSALVELKPHGIIILEIVMAAKALQARMHPLTSFGVLVTRGPSGAVLIDKYGRVRTQPSFPADNVRDTTGAGTPYIHFRSLHLVNFYW